ncbi:MAG: redoxin domain-containing protein [Armatimonadetes bacterium]|nr:redoxin domain-containing protein [Armatimonadota bacterium]
MGNRRSWVLAGVLLALVAAFVTTYAVSPGPRASGPAPDFTGMTVDGQTIRLADFKGNYAVLLNFFSAY